MKHTRIGDTDRLDRLPPRRLTPWRLVGALGLAVALASVLGGPGNAQPTPAAGRATPSLATHFTTQPGKPHQLVVVDPTREAIAVYKIDPDSGAIAFVSMRHIGWDLQMEEFNAKELRSPREIRDALQATR